MAHRYGSRRRKSRTSHHRKSAKRVRAGKKAWRTRQRHARRGHPKHARRVVRRRRHHTTIAYCSRGRCARRPIFGGQKGLRTHIRRKHGGRR